jgi:hypothetical protein
MQCRERIGLVGAVHESICGLDMSVGAVQGRRSVVIDFRGFLPGVRTSHTGGYIAFSRASFHGYIVARSTFAIHKAVADRDATEDWKYP